MKNLFKNKKVIITGHTGFKGSWLTVWLLNLGAKIIGISKDIPTKPSLFKSLKLKRKIINIKLDIRNNKVFSVMKVVKNFKKYWPKVLWVTKNKKKSKFTESTLLKLNSKKAKRLLKWKSVLTFNETIKLTAEWYKDYYNNSKTAKKQTINQIKNYQEILEKRL